MKSKFFIKYLTSPSWNADVIAYHGWIMLFPPSLRSSTAEDKDVAESQTAIDFISLLCAKN